MYDRTCIIDGGRVVTVSQLPERYLQLGLSTPRDKLAVVCVDPTEVDDYILRFQIEDIRRRMCQAV